MIDLSHFSFVLGEYIDNDTGTPHTDVSGDKAEGKWKMGVSCQRSPSPQTALYFCDRQ